MPRLELDIDAEPGDDGGEPHVRGVVRADDGTEREFLGWIGLVALLQQATDASASQASFRRQALT